MIAHTATDSATRRKLELVLQERDFAGHAVRFLLGPEDITMTEATRAIGERLGMPDLPYVTFPPDDVKVALQGAGMSVQVAGLIVDMQLALNEGTYFEGVRRTPESTTPSRFHDFLDMALPDDAMERGGASR